MSPAIALEAVVVRRGGAEVIDGVDLTVQRGAWFGLIGANGSGKTSLLRAIGGRLAFSAGRCALDGAECTHDLAARATRIGFAPPADRLPDALRGRELLDLVGGDLGRALSRLGPLRDALGIDALLDRWLGDCSAGMRQRLAIAVAFARDDAIVILDEPFNWLDPVAAFDVKRALRTVVDGGLTLITALHDLTTLVTSCDEGAMLVDGRVALTLDAAMLQDAAGNPQAFEQRAIDLLRSGGATA